MQRMIWCALLCTALQPAVWGQRALDRDVPIRGWSGNVGGERASAGLWNAGRTARADEPHAARGNADLALPEPLEESRPQFGSGGWITTPDPALPDVLILGDSISIGYTRQVKHLLLGRANVWRPVEPGKDAPANCRFTGFGLEQLDQWLGATRWKVIHFNFGLHDIAYRNPELKTAGQLDKVNGRISVPPEQYEENLGALVARLKQTGACLVWANTTVVPPGEPGRNEGDERRYNAIAERIMRRNAIPVNDLHSTTARFPLSRFTAPGNVHFTVDGYWELGEQVSKAVEAALERCR